ncbi:MAG TPA: hypothetical protein VGI81_17310 [Tepidisphaeraceae bacterium]|jgi:DMSO/TMAO reductase YedYZ molybdopterin-dependent catalytic subunit
MSRSCYGRTVTLGILIALASGWARAEAPGADAAVKVGGAVNKPTDWSIAKLKEAFADQLKQVEYTAKGQKHVSTCVPLLAIVQAAEPVTDPKHKNFAMRLAVVVRAADGYAATFGLGDLMPDVGNHPAWIAIDMDGQPLSGREAPAKLIVPGDAKPTRAVWGVARIDVVDPTVAGQPNGK